MQSLSLLPICSCRLRGHACGHTVTQDDIPASIQHLPYTVRGTSEKDYFMVCTLILPLSCLFLKVTLGPAVLPPSYVADQHMQQTQNYLKQQQQHAPGSGSLAVGQAVAGGCHHLPLEGILRGPPDSEETRLYGTQPVPELVQLQQSAAASAGYPLETYIGVFVKSFTNPCLIKNQLHP